MQSIKRRFSWWIFGGILIFGEILPSLIANVFLFKYQRSGFPSIEFMANPFMIAVHAIPVVAFAFIAKFLWEKKPAQLAGIVGAGVGVFGSILLLNFTFWVDLFLGDTSSTGSLVFLAVPVCGLFSIPIGFGCGTIIGRWIGHIRSKRKRTSSPDNQERDVHPSNS